MLPFTYYFRNSYKKSWYARGKLSKMEYKQRVQDGKDTNLFVSNLVDNVLEDQKKTVDTHIEKLEREKNILNNALNTINQNKNEQIDIIKNKLDDENKILKWEKDKIQKEFEETSLLDSEKIATGREILKKLLEFLWLYSNEVQQTVKNQSDSILEQRKWILKKNIKLTVQEVQSQLKDNTTKTNDKIKIDRESLWYFLILSLFCIFDVFLGYVWIVWFLRRSIESEWWVVALWFFLALVLIPLAISIIHFSVVAKEKWGVTKQLWTISIIVALILVIIYACQSVSKEEWILLHTISFNPLNLSPFIDVLKWNTEFLLRCFIIPSLFVGEILIDKINWDTILIYFGFWKHSSWSKIKSLIQKILFFLQSHKISKYAQEEQKELSKIIEEMKKEEVPVFVEVKKDINEINTILNPIMNSQEQKIQEYNTKMANIQAKMEENTWNYNKHITEINNRYAPDILTQENKKKIIENKINKLKQDYNQALVSAKEWILIGLIDD